MEVRRFDYRTEYYQGDIIHREDGPAVEYKNGDGEYFINGKRHREDGPAVERTNIKLYISSYNGFRYTQHVRNYKAYYIWGKLHREGGPVVIKDNHAEIRINGEKISATDEYYIPVKSTKK